MNTAKPTPTVQAGDGGAMQPQQWFSSMMEQSSQLQTLRSKYRKLQDDFAYNLRLLGDRDRELAGYDAKLAALKEQLVVHDREASELRVAAASAAREAEEREEETAQELADYKRQLVDATAEVERVQQAGQVELAAARKSSTATQRTVERKLFAAEERLVQLRAELQVEFDATTNRITSELQEQIAMAEARVLEEQSKGKQLTIQLEAATNRCSVLEGELRAAREAATAEEVRQNRREWEERERRHSEMQRIAQIEWQLEHEKATMVQTVARLEQKVQVLCEGIQQQEKALLDRERTVFNREAAAKDSAAVAQAQLVEMRRQVEEANHRHQTVVTRLKQAADRCRATVSAVQKRAAEAEADLNQRLALRDDELRALQEQLAEHAADRRSSESDLNRLRREVKSALDAERAAKEQLSGVKEAWGAWVKDFEGRSKAERDELTFSLLEERGSIERELTEAKSTIEQQRAVLTTIQHEKHEALELAAAWRKRASKHGVERESTKDLTDEGLLQENESLRSAIKKMRHEMEAAVREASENVTIATNNESGTTLTDQGQIITGDREIQLAQASASIRRLVYEREKLMEINNALRLQLDNSEIDTSNRATNTRENERKVVTDSGEPRQTASKSGIAAPSMMSMQSSVGSESVREVFRMLDDDTSDHSGEMSLELQGETKSLIPRLASERPTPRPPRPPKSSRHPVRHFGRDAEAAD